jgi:hypothetical protein
MYIFDNLAVIGQANHQLNLFFRYKFEKDGSIHRLIIKDCRLDDECEYACGVEDRKSRARLFVEGMKKKNNSNIIDQF